MDIPTPKYNLDIHSVGHGAMTGRMLEAIEQIAIDEKPDLLLVYGDTNSTLAGALAAKKLHIKVAHVEAGLRSFNMAMPEEVNRILTDRISDFLFCPTQNAVDNLNAEGYQNFGAEVVRTGDVMYDAARYYAAFAPEKSTLPAALLDGDYVLCTLHRAENTDDPIRLQAIADALTEIHQTARVVVPLHPRTRAKLKNMNIDLKVDIIDPVGYFEMIELLRHCKLVLTDSGGLQKEAYFFEKNCVTLRDQTEWVELVEHGYNVLAGASTSDILTKYAAMRNLTNDFGTNLYGDGHAAEVIVAHLKGALS
jgi:UDP-GlcNAc3NAcA epimerase